MGVGEDRWEAGGRMMVVGWKWKGNGQNISRNHKRNSPVYLPLEK
jgi:hypothetical protein